jgi:hypothetical protein
MKKDIRQKLMEAVYDRAVDDAIGMIYSFEGWGMDKSHIVSIYVKERLNKGESLSASYFDSYK